MITHKMSDALAYGNRLVMVQDGQIKLDVRGAEKQALRTDDLVTMFAAEVWGCRCKKRLATADDQLAGHYLT